MLEMGVIKRVDEPTDWCAPIGCGAKALRRSQDMC